MTEKSTTTNVVRALLQGFTGAGLFRRLSYPGAPACFVDPRSLAELIAAGEVDRDCRIFAESRYFTAKDEARQQRRDDEETKVASVSTIS